MGCGGATTSCGESRSCASACPSCGVSRWRAYACQRPCASASQSSCGGPSCSSCACRSSSASGCPWSCACGQPCSSGACRSSCACAWRPPSVRRSCVRRSCACACRPPSVRRSCACGRSRPSCVCRSPYGVSSSPSFLLRVFWCRSLLLRHSSLRRTFNLLLVGYPFDQLARLRIFALAGNIGLRQDSNQTAIFLHDGKPSHLMLCHQLERFVEVLLRIDGDEIFRSDLSDRRHLSIFPFRDDTGDDVAIRHHADETIALGHGQRADVFACHQFRCLGDGCRRVDLARITCHCVTDVFPHRICTSLVVCHNVRLPAYVSSQTVTLTDGSDRQCTNARVRAFNVTRSG